MLYRNYNLTFKRFVYWPPQFNNKSTILNLPSGKKCFVFMGKRDCDGKLEPVLCFIDKLGNKLMWLNREEVHQFDKLINRIESYFDLFKDK
ncbi:uncharacterized protein TA06275 [Theileria annulata]|uniref:Uncharacterized protein n=1 Tax=Theileria annulata TaxID=5874 RepID=Q4UI89_THEAN|nr:uncharacterized protein TA06275 [Theileria annulata]CAI73200.1 hypothetical protein, conserved [Theileria annulata]|eukprot:XP_953878.1 hypothetical protein, conserved [Theileria annulata]